MKLNKKNAFLIALLTLITFYILTKFRKKPVVIEAVLVV